MFLDAVYFFCLLFACGHVGFFLLGGVAAPYRYAFWTEVWVRSPLQHFSKIFTYASNYMIITLTKVRILNDPSIFFRQGIN